MSLTACVSGNWISKGNSLSERRISVGIFNPFHPIVEVESVNTSICLPVGLIKAATGVTELYKKHIVKLCFCEYAISLEINKRFRSCV